MTARQACASDPALQEVDVSVVVVNYNTAELLLPMRDALMASRAALRLQVIVIDNASRDGSLAVLRREFADAHLIANRANVGFGRANNQALPHLRGRYLLLLNTDAFVAPDTLVKTVAFMDAHGDCGVLGVRLAGRQGEPQPGCRFFPTPWNVFLARTGLARWFPATRMVDDAHADQDLVRECDWVPGCYYLVRREVADAVGLFDPRYFLYCEEVDHCRAVKAAGWKVVYFPHTTVVHLGGESAKSDSPLTVGLQISALQIESELLYFRKHHGLPGFGLALFLATVADTFIALKRLAKRRSPSHAGDAAAHLGRVWQLAWRTRLGTRATR